MKNGQSILYSTDSSPHLPLTSTAAQPNIDMECAAVSAVSERNVFYDLANYLDSGDKKSAKRKMLELAKMVQIRNEEYNKKLNALRKSMTKNNRVQTIIGITGIVVTYFVARIY